MRYKLSGTPKLFLRCRLKAHRKPSASLLKRMTRIKKRRMKKMIPTMTSLPLSYDVTNPSTMTSLPPSTMTSLPLYYDITNPSTMTSLPLSYDITGPCTTSRTKIFLLHVTDPSTMISLTNFMLPTLYYARRCHYRNCNTVY